MSQASGMSDYKLRVLLEKPDAEGLRYFYMQSIRRQRRNSGVMAAATTPRISLANRPKSGR